MRRHLKFVRTYIIRKLKSKDLASRRKYSRVRKFKKTYAGTINWKVNTIIGIK